MKRENGRRILKKILILKRGKEPSRSKEIDLYENLFRDSPNNFWESEQVSKFQNKNR